MVDYIFDALMKAAGIRLNTELSKFEFSDDSASSSSASSSSSFSTAAGASAFAAARAGASSSSQRLSDEAIEDTDRTGTDKQGGKKRKPKRRRRANTDLSEAQKHVHFGQVEQIVFARSCAFDKIPERGLFPLGLGAEIKKESYSLDEFYEIQNLRISEAPPQAARARGYSADGAIESSEFSAKLEKAKLQPLREDERKLLLTDESATGRDGGGSVEHHGNHHQSLLSEVNHDVKLLQATRLHTGCQCKPVKVDKMSTGKMKAELIQGGSSPDEVEKLSKTELIAKVKVFMQSCALCTANNCECVQNEIACNAEVCGCLRGGMQRRAQSCANVYGKVIFDPIFIKEYRRKMLDSLTN